MTDTDPLAGELRLLKTPRAQAHVKEAERHERSAHRPHSPPLPDVRSPVYCPTSPAYCPASPAYRPASPAYEPAPLIPPPPPISGVKRDREEPQAFFIIVRTSEEAYETTVRALPHDGGRVATALERHAREITLVDDAVSRLSTAIGEEISTGAVMRLIHGHDGTGDGDLTTDWTIVMMMGGAVRICGVIRYDSELDFHEKKRAF